MMRSEASVISSPGATTVSDASEDEPLRKPMPKSELTPWLSKEQRKNQQLVADQRAKIYIPEVEKVKRVIMAKIASVVKVATGSGDRQGPKYHSIEIDLVTSCAARAIFWDLPRTGPTKRGKKTCFNWEVKADKMHLLARLLSFEDHRVSSRKGWDNGIMRKGGSVMVAVIPNFLVEHQYDTDDCEKLLISFYTAEMNTRGVISWPPTSIYDTGIEYKKVEAFMWGVMYRSMWINLPHSRGETGGWHVMNWRFQRLS